MRYGDHLWKVNDSHSLVLVHHQVELIEIRVNESDLALRQVALCVSLPSGKILVLQAVCASTRAKSHAYQSHDQAHACVIHTLGLAQVRDLVELCALDEAHDHYVARMVDGLWHRKPMFVKHPHKCVLLDCREPGQVQPRCGLAVQ